MEIVVILFMRRFTITGISSVSTKDGPTGPGLM